MPRPKGLPKTGGRQKGAANKKTREIADRAVREDITPLEVQLRTMRMLWDKALEGSVPDLELAKQACAVASQAAPFIHPRLAAIVATATVTTVEQASPEEAQRLAMAALEKAFGVPPRQIALSPAATSDIIIPAEVP